MIDLAKKLTRKGDQYIIKNGLTSFHKYAAELLAASDFHKIYNFKELALHSLNTKVKQNYPQMEFSDLPVTLYRGENCFIDIYFWRRRPTMIHNHHFNGAFMCLEGKNVDLEFSYKKERKLGKYHDLGTLTLNHERTLVPGDIVPIDLLDKFIHQNHHQAELTVNLCFRTPEIKGSNISSYLFSGLRTEKNQEMMLKVHRLRRLLDLGSVDVRDINFSNDDALFFLTQYLGSGSHNKALALYLKKLHAQVKKELKVDLEKLLLRHEEAFDQIENEYE